MKKVVLGTIVVASLASALSANWFIHGKKMIGTFPIQDKSVLSTDHGGDLSPIDAYQDGNGVYIAGNIGVDSKINNSAYNDLVLKYGKAAKLSGLSITKQVLIGNNGNIPTAKDIRLANLIKNTQNLAEAQSNATTCNPSTSLTRSDLDDMISNNEDVTHVCTSGITDMSNLFKYKGQFNQDISGWDVSNVTNMKNMFYSAKSFNQPIGNWDTSKVTSMDGMFHNATLFNQDISGWNTSAVINMSGMFDNAGNFNQNIGNWNMSNVETTSYMFAYANSFNQDISTWNMSNVTNMAFMFRQASHFNENISKWDTSNVTNMDYLFYKASSFNQNISGWDVSNVERNHRFSLNSPIDGTTKSPF